MMVSPARSRPVLAVLTPSEHLSNVAGGLPSCVRCSFASRGGYVDWHYGKPTPSTDIHCGAFDRRVTPVKGCAKFWREGSASFPLPLEH